MTYRSRVRDILASLKTHPRKTLSQNFMTDEGTLEAIVDTVREIPAETILESGPGLGFLTEHLTHLKKPILAVEKDKRFCTYLKKCFQDNPEVQILEGDILTFPFEKFLTKKTACVGNIPYQISSPILEVLLKNRNISPVNLLTTQKDFALRLAASPGTRACGAISCWMQLHAEIKILRDINKSSFYPAPKVDSSLLKISFFETPLYSERDGSWIHDAIRYSFQKRRKHL